MLRQLFTFLGVVELLAPRPLVELVTRLAYESPEEFEVRPWVLTAVRVEGVLLLAVAARMRWRELLVKTGRAPAEAEV
ncbi:MULTISPECIES: hypothetical protein [Halorussus]|uniref:hypothetical protein n=1 Tax=Halorussus TaxID=1070314 RepID=UPI00209DC520|nr:hypothetical protein [Halorussus vallis]USZ77179.1 hypothetical protein NGM07_07575 [Halorussus vallis]